MVNRAEERSLTVEAKKPPKKGGFFNEGRLAVNRQRLTVGCLGMIVLAGRSQAAQFVGDDAVVEAFEEGVGSGQWAANGNFAAGPIAYGR